MNITIISLVTLLFSLYSSAQERFLIKGDITGLPDGTKLYLKHTEVYKVDSAFVKNGKFHFGGTVQLEPEFHYVFIEKKKESLRLFLDNSTVNIKGDIADWPNLMVKGSKSHDQFIACVRLFDALGKEWDSIKVKYEAAQNLGDTITRNILGAKFDKNAQKVTCLKQLYISQNPNSLYAPFMILNDMYMDLETKDAMYNQLSTNVRNSFYGKQLNDRLRISKMTAQIKIDNIAPNFISKTIQGNILSLRDVISKSKLTLIDFWASWCLPCRKETPNIIKVYNLYHEKGLNVISVSFDYNENEWKNAVSKDGMNWYNVSDLKGRDAEVHRLFSLNGIPAYILLDSTGKIIVIDAPGAGIPSEGGTLRGDELYKKVEEFLGKKESQ